MKKVLSKCIICKILQGKTLLPLSTAKFPECRLYFEYPFENVGLDYAGPLFALDSIGKIDKHSNLIYSYLHVLLHGTHLELVISESSDLLLLAIRRFIARKRLPRAFVSNNFKTFKSNHIKHLLLSLNIK